MIRKALLAVAVLMLAACDSGTSQGTTEREQAQSQQQVMVTCPMCNGTGQFSLMPGDVMAPTKQCDACNGTGQVDAATANQVMQAQQQAQPSNRGNRANGGGRASASQCPNCYGHGRCTQCAGNGEVYNEGNYGQKGGKMKCPTCKGTGRCNMCRGSGQI